MLGTQAENALRNERKDYFDEFSNLLRRFARVQGQDDSGEEFIRFLRTDFPSIVHEVSLNALVPSDHQIARRQNDSCVRSCLSPFLSLICMIVSCLLLC